MSPDWDQPSYKATSNGKVSEPPKQDPDLGMNLSRMENFVPESPRRSLSDVVLPDSVAEQIYSALNQIQHREKLYNEWNLKKIDPNGSRTAINFFGPPGTGKSFAAEAIAHYIGKKIIKVNYAEIESKYVGETPKNIAAAFTKAKESDSILFFDEADSVLGKRLTSVTQSADHGVNVSRSVMLLQLDNFDGVVLFATNLPENFDGAFVRRILAHIEFVLPDLDCRKKLWNYLFPNEVPRHSSIEIKWLAKESEGLSGGDILNVVKLSAGRAVSRPADECKVLQSDIIDAILQVRNAREKVASQFSTRNTTVKEEVISPSELSPQEQDQYNQVIGNLKQS
jgi:SpoVK/Ycf46/Vps4 family AAA+-type ATPase